MWISFEMSPVLRVYFRVTKKINPCPTTCVILLNQSYTWVSRLRSDLKICTTDKFNSKNKSFKKMASVLLKDLSFWFDEKTKKERERGEKKKKGRKGGICIWRHVFFGHNFTAASCCPENIFVSFEWFIAIMIFML